MRTILLLAVALGAACSNAKSARQPHPDGGPYKDLVHDNRDKTLDERMKVYLPLARTLRSGGKTPSQEEGFLAALARDLVLAEDFAVLEALEWQIVDRDRKWHLWMEVSARDETPGAGGLLKQWAQAHPEEIRLARYRPDGIEFLLAKLEDETLNPTLRAHSAWELVRAGDTSVIPRMRKLAQDETHVSLRSLRAGSGTPTLGEIVQRCIRELQRTGE